jgi:O-antigen/teichoic acid export membrane protein
MLLIASAPASRTNSSLCDPSDDVRECLRREPTTTTEELEQGHRSDAASSVRRKGAAGAALLTVRTAAAQAVAFGGTLVLTHLLAPSELGVVAIGATVVAIGTFFSDGGLGAALIRKPAEPTVAELQTLLGVQVALAVAIAGVVTAVGLQTGSTGAVTAVMTWSLPLLALRAPHLISLERALSYRAVAWVEFVESLVQYGWSVATVWALGWGVWGLATAAIARAMAGSVLMAAASPLPALTVPRIQRSTLRSMIGFGAGVQAVGIAGLARTQGVNLVIAAVGGEQTLGLWSLATRLLFVPFWLFQALWRVSYPTMARLRTLGENTSRTVERLAAMTALATGAILAPLAVSANNLVPALFGSAWAGAAGPLAWASAGLVVSGPVSVAASGYLFSEGDIRSPLKAATSSAVVFLVLTAILVGPLGVSGAGVAWMFAAFVEALMFAGALRRRAQVSVERFVGVPIILAFLSALGAWAMPQPSSSQLVDGLTTAIIALIAYAALNFVFNRDNVIDAVRRVRSLR